MFSNFYKLQISAPVPFIIGKCDYEAYPEFDDMKTSLNRTKSEMDSLFTGPYAANVSTLSNMFRPTSGIAIELTTKYNAQIVTRAWVKFYEIYHHFADKLFVPFTGINAFCNAELPGASVCALNHFMKTRYQPKSFNWRANSLVPERERNALEDKYGLWECNQANWLMDNSNNGDTTSQHNVENFAAKLDSFKPNLYTHDAGISVEDSQDPSSYNKQESKNAKLHYGAALAGLLTLSKGGNFIAKQYTLFEPVTVSLLVFYASMFSEFYLVKPSSSGMNNSESYLVGIGFMGLLPQNREFLLTNLDNEIDRPIISRREIFDRAPHAIGQIRQFNTKRTDDQIKSIKKTISLLDKYKDNPRNANREKFQLYESFNSAFFKSVLVKKIREDHKIPSKSRITNRSNSRNYPRPSTSTSIQGVDGWITKTR
jgi:hypothetical protein